MSTTLPGRGLRFRGDPVLPFDPASLQVAMEITRHIDADLLVLWTTTGMTAGEQALPPDTDRIIREGRMVHVAARLPSGLTVDASRAAGEEDYRLSLDKDLPARQLRAFVADAATVTRIAAECGWEEDAGDALTGARAIAGRIADQLLVLGVAEMVSGQD